METIQEFSDRIDDMITSIKPEDINSQEFIGHKYMLLSLHVHTERDKIERAKLASEEILSSRKIYNLYLSIQKTLTLKSNTGDPKEMYNHLLKSQELIRKANERHNK